MCRICYVSPLENGYLQVEKGKNLVSNYTRLVWVVYSGEASGEVDTRSGMCCVGWVVWAQGFWYYVLCLG